MTFLVSTIEPSLRFHMEIKYIVAWNIFYKFLYLIFSNYFFHTVINIVWLTSVLDGLNSQAATSWFIMKRSLVLFTFHPSSPRELLGKYSSSSLKLFVASFLDHVPCSIYSPRLGTISQLNNSQLISQFSTFNKR